MFVIVDALDRPERKLQGWQLRVLCFVITRDPEDRSEALSCALELDTLGRGRSAAFSFFVRTTREVCDAVLASGHQRTDAILRRYASRIDDPQLRRAFRSAAGLPEIGRGRKCEVPKPASFIGSGAVPEAFRLADQQVEYRGRSRRVCRLLRIEQAAHVDADD
jgi:hypothetical protein